MNENLKNAVEEFMGVIEKLDWDESQAVIDDIATIGILAKNLSPGQLQDKDMQWVFAHLLGDIGEVLEAHEGEEGMEDVDDAELALATELNKEIGAIECPDLREALDNILSDEEPIEEDDDENDGGEALDNILSDEEPIEEDDDENDGGEELE